MLSAVLVIAAGLRLYHLGDADFWLDELFTLEISTGRGLADLHLPRDQMIEGPVRLTSLDGAPPITSIWTHGDDDTAPPLYYLCLRIWRSALGDSEFVVRLLSVLMSLAALALLYPVAAAKAGRAPALWGCLLLAIASPQIVYAQETRNYAMAMATTLAAGWALLRLEQSGRWRDAALLGVAIFVTMLVHYFAIAIAVALAVYALVRLRGPSLRRAILAVTIAAACYLLIWGPMLWDQQRAFVEANPMPADPDGHFLRTCARALWIPFRLFGTREIDPIELAAIPAAGLLFLLIALRKRKDLLLWAMWAAFPILLVLTLDLINTTQQLTLIRYTLLATPGICMLIAAAPPPSWGIFRHLVPAVAVVCFCWFTPIAYTDWKGDWTSAATLLARHSNENPVVFYSMDQRRSGWMQLGISHYAPQWSGPFILATSPERIDATRSSVVMINDPGIDPHHLWPGIRVEESVHFPNVGAVHRVSWSGAESR